MARGGKRPGAGAPKGNLNGFKHGRHSRPFQRLLDIISKDPEAVALFHQLGRRNQRRAARLRKQAEEMLYLLAQRAEQARANPIKEIAPSNPSADANQAPVD